MNESTYELSLRRLATLLSVAILTAIATAAITGGLLAFYYEPTASGAHESLKAIATEVSYGWLIRSLHDLAGNGAIALALIEIVVMFLGRQATRSWLTAWVSGILFTLCAIALGWSAIILDWDQAGFWRFRLELATIEAVPFIGSALKQALIGGNAIASVTIQHFYALHGYALPLAAFGLAIVQLLSLRNNSTISPTTDTNNSQSTACC